MLKKRVLMGVCALLSTQAMAQQCPTYNYEKVNFYVVAHQDDWQLFMGAPAYRSIHEGQNQASSQKNVFIYVTAGNASSGWAPNSYTTAREDGAMASIRLAADEGPQGNNPPCSVVVTSPVPSFNGHSIRKVVYKNTVSYFLRLPDASICSKNEYDDNQCSPEDGRSKLQGLRLLTVLPANDPERPNMSLPLAAIDGSTSYSSWADLCTTLGAIFTAETTGSTMSNLGGNIWLNIHDTQARNIETDHGDHYVSSEAALAGYTTAFGSMSTLPGITYYIGYPSNKMATNLSATEIIQEAGLYVAYNTMKTNAGHNTDWQWDDNAWCSRCYFRSVGPGYSYQNYANSNSIWVPGDIAYNRSAGTSSPASPQPQQESQPAQLYPNPVKDEITLLLGPEATDKRLTVEVLQAGTEQRMLQVKHYTRTTGGIRFSVAGLRAGHYWVRVAAPSGRTLTMKRFEKE